MRILYEGSLHPPGVSGVTGPALRETSCINRSLAALSDVLGALAEGRGHIPYRNSRLTHLLQDALGTSAPRLPGGPLPPALPPYPAPCPCPLLCPMPLSPYPAPCSLLPPSPAPGPAPPCHTAQGAGWLWGSLPPSRDSQLLLTRWLSQGLCDPVAVERGHHRPLGLGPMFPGCGPRNASLSRGTTRLHLWSQGLLLLRPQDEEGAASSSAAAPDLRRPGLVLRGVRGAGWGWAPTVHARISTAELRFPPSSASLLLFPSQVFF